MGKKILSLFVVSLFVLLTLALIRQFNLAFPIYIVNTTRTSEFSVTGEGKVDVIPDTGYVDLGMVVNNASTPQDAQQKINLGNNEIVDHMKKIGIKKEDITTSNYSVSPNYSYDSNPPRITGYNANVTVSIKVRKIDMMSQVLEEAQAAGVNQVQGTRSTIDNPDKYRQEARDKAITNAKEQAQQLAQKLGIHLGAITNIVEGSNNPVPIPLQATAFGRGGASDKVAPEIEQGSQTVSSVVTLYFEKD